MSIRFISALFLLITFHSKAQKTIKIIDTSTNVTYLAEITLVGRGTNKDMVFAPELVGTQINAGKKNNVIITDNIQGNVVTNTMRQVMAKIPGLQVWESDPSGVQIGIAARGLSPNRSWEFNTKQNGYDISSDPLGYPEAYYTPQLNAVQRIQVVRGAGSLQYGPQFGGMVNFIMKDGSEINKPIKFETQQTVGSFGLFNAFNALGGTSSNKKIHYYSFWDRRSSNGSRPNSNFIVNTAYATLGFSPNKKLKFNIDYTNFQYTTKQPGGLTDNQFLQDAMQSVKHRNWFGINWNILASTFNYKVNEKLELDIKIFGLKGIRSSVGFLSTPNIFDTINFTTKDYNKRRIDIDEYNNGGIEARLLNTFSLLGKKQTLVLGFKYYDGNTIRKQNGIGTTGVDFNIQEASPYPTLVKFKSRNAAFSLENIIRINNKFLLIPGVRLEHIYSKATGRIGFTNNGAEILMTESSKQRKILLAGIATEYHFKNSEIYTNITQAYRPILFSDIVANPTTDIIDQNLKDASGYNTDLGFRGKLKEYLTFDISVFYLKYNNRVGLIAQQNSVGGFYNLRTNVGNSNSYGTELFADFNLTKYFNKKNKHHQFSVFSSIGYTKATYLDVRVITKSGTTLIESNLKDKRVENAPEWILRSGVNYHFKKISMQLQYNYTASTFSDANNTLSSSTGVNGIIPEYWILDLSAQYKINTNINLKTGINNVLNKKYFTRRSGGYPGPGILTAEPMNLFLTLSCNL